MSQHDTFIMTSANRLIRVATKGKSAATGGVSLSSCGRSGFFFFQAEDGIRDVAVTGVQTCALPICVQSLDDAILPRLGRLHDQRGARLAFEASRDAGFSNVSVDLMYGLPGLDLEGWSGTVDAVLDWQPEHLSAYGLTLDAGSLWGAAGVGGLPPEETVVAQYWRLTRAAAERGFEHYEISNYARPGFRSRHNQIYWRAAEYLAAGPGACGFVGRVRYANARATPPYCQTLEEGRLPVDTFEEVTPRPRLPQPPLPPVPPPRRRAPARRRAPLPRAHPHREGRSRGDGLPRPAAHERRAGADGQGVPVLRELLPAVAGAGGAGRDRDAAHTALGDRRFHGADVVAPVGCDEADGPPAGAAAQAHDAGPGGADPPREGPGARRPRHGRRLGHGPGGHARAAALRRRGALDRARALAAVPRGDGRAGRGHGGVAHRPARHPAHARTGRHPAETRAPDG